MEWVPYRRASRLLGSDVLRETIGVRREGLSVYVIHAAGAPFDARVSPCVPTLRGGRECVLTLPLAGAYVSFRGGERVVAAGEAIVEDVASWDERWEPGLQALVVQWTSPRRFSTESVRVDMRIRQHAERVAAALRAGADPAPAIASFARRLRSRGFEVPHVPQSPLPDEIVQVERAMAELLTQLDRAPAAVDLARLTGRSERQLRRIFASHPTWLGSFRERLRHARLPSAAAWLAATDHSTERVARSLGYGSARALVRALDDAGYPGRASARRRIG